jgi:hypothetical protein
MTLSLDLSKRLHELGVKVETHCHWCAYESDPDIEFIDDEPERLYDTYTSEDMIIPAPTFEELWAVLPRYIGGKDSPKRELCLSKRGNNMVGSYPPVRFGALETYDVFEAPICADVAGKMLEWLAESGHLKCEHEWGIDGLHTNEYCKKCFKDKPSGGE